MNTIRRFWPSVVAVLALLAAAQPAVAQVTETGTIEVLVQDAAGLPIPGATVVASAADTVTKREGVYRRSRDGRCSSASPRRPTTS